MLLAGAALLGNLGYSWLGPRLPRRFVLVAAIAIAGAPRYAVMALEPGLIVLLIVLGVAGLASGAINPVLSVISYERVVPAMRGRVLGLTSALAFSGAPLGALVGGVLVDGIGLAAALWSAGAVYALVVLAMAVLPVWRDLDPAPTTTNPTPTSGPPNPPTAPATAPTDP